MSSTNNPERWAILDCNSFYCSCERLFRPHLRDKPIVVLSNNDGCIISLSKEAKALGIKMGSPIFEVRPLIRKHRVQVFSSHYLLYGNLSRRVMGLLDELNPDVIQYSIDEAFINFSHLPLGAEAEWALELRERVTRETGIPVSLGVGHSKTLAKIANKEAKKLNLKSLTLIDPHLCEEVLRRTPLEEVWGIGPGLSMRLKLLGLESAWDFSQFENVSLIRKHLGIVGERMQAELKGRSCIELGEIETRKMISSTRSFGKKVLGLRELQEAVSTYVGFAAEKLRSQGSVTRGLSVMLRSNPFDEGVYHRREDQMILPFYTDDTFILTKEATRMVAQLFKEGIGYKKAGVFLFDLSQKNSYQLDLFSQAPRESMLMPVIDKINQRWGRGAIRTASCGTQQDWRMLCEKKSTKTQTSWSDLVEVGED